MNLDKIAKSFCSDAASISSLLHIQRNQMTNKLVDRLIDFLNDEQMFAMVIWGPSQCGKTYLLTTILDHFTPFEQCKDYLSINNQSVNSIKNKLNNCTNNKFYLIQNIKKIQNLQSLIKFVHKKRKKCIFILSNKQYILNGKIMKKSQCVVFPVNYLSPEEMRQNLNQVNSIQINESTWMSKNIFMKNFYNLLKKPKYFKKTKHHWQPENIDQEFSENVDYDQMNAVYSLNSFIYSFKSFALLLDFNIDASIDAAIDATIDVNIDVDSIIQKLAKLNDQFKLVVLNQLLSDLFNEKKICDIKSGCFVIKVNRYDTEVSPFVLSRIKCLNLKCIFLVNDTSLFLKYKYLFDFKFKLSSLSSNDVLMESIGHIDLPAIDYVKSVKINLDQTIQQLFSHVFVEGRVPSIQNRPNVLNIDLEKENTIFSKGSMSKLIYKYLIKRKTMILIVRKFSNLDQTSLIQKCIGLKIKLIVQVEPQFRNKHKLVMLLGNNVVHLKQHQTDIDKSLNTELILLLEKCQRFASSYCTNVYLCYYFQLKRMEQMAFAKYFNFDIPIEKDENLDNSIRSLSSLIKSVDYNMIEFLDPKFEVYFTALFIIRELLSDKQSTQERIRSLILKYRYYKKFAPLWHFIAEALSNENSYFKSLNLNQEKLLIDYWKIILSCSNKDLIGVYHNHFLQSCLDRSNLDNAFFCITHKKKSENTQSSCFESKELLDEKSEHFVFDNVNNGLKHAVEFLKINCFEKKPIYVRKFNFMCQSLISFAKSNGRQLFKFYQCCLENHFGYVLLTSSLIKEHLLDLIRQLGLEDSSVMSECCVLLHSFMIKNNGSRLKFISARSLATLKKEVDCTVLDVLIENYLLRKDFWYNIPGLIRKSYISSAELIEKVFVLITENKDLHLVKALFSLLSNSSKYKNEILGFKIDLNNLSNTLKAYYFDLHFNLGSCIYLNELIDLVFIENIDLIFKLHNYVPKLNSKFELNKRLCFLFKQDSFVSKLDYFIQYNFFQVELCSSLFKLLKVDDIHEFVKLLIKHDQLDLNLNHVTEYLFHLIESGDNSLGTEWIVDHVMPTLRLIVNEEKTNSLIIDLIKLIITKFIQSKNVFKSVNNLFIQLVRHVGTIPELDVSNFVELLLFYHTEVQRHQKCFIKKKNLDKLKSNSEEIAITFGHILRFLDSVDFLQITLDKHKQSHSNDYLRLFVKKCAACHLSVLIEENEMLVIDEDVILDTKIEDVKTFQFELNKLVEEETKYLQINKLIVLNDKSLHRIRQT